MASVITMAMALRGGLAITTIAITKSAMTMARKVAGTAAGEQGGHAGAAAETASALNIENNNDDGVVID